ncbi:MAG TPA: hypothetical protein VEK07_12535 [Polyangiaceae bacterium]|nr:hypothetical protein [Polyangiaceae bacterium]
MKRGSMCLVLASGAVLVTEACRVVVDQPPSAQPYAYAYPTATAPGAAYPARSYPTATYPTSNPARATPTASYAPRTAATASYPTASSAIAARPPPASSAPSQTPAPQVTRTSFDDTSSGQPTRAGSAAPPACLDAASVELPDCELVRRPLARCSPQTTPQQRCAGYRTYFDPKVAASAISCLSALTSRQLCDVNRASDCAKIALAEACLDSSVQQLCQIAEGPCKTTASVCAASLSGLNDEGQQRVAECVARGCEGGIDGCLDALTSGRAPSSSSSSAARSTVVE